MILKEIEMDLPYVREGVQELLSEADTQLDYETNWKDKRREFQLSTRCMTAMIERIIPRIVTKDCWKILIECVERPFRNEVINLLGVYCVQVPFDINCFWEMSSQEKKAYTIRKIREALVIIAPNDCFDVTEIALACDEVVKNDYVNEWYWKKPIKSKHLSAQVKVSHEPEGAHLYMVFRDDLNNVQEEKHLVSDLPDERAYSKYLGKLEWISEGTAKLTAKSGECFVAAYEYHGGDKRMMISPWSRELPCEPGSAYFYFEGLVYRKADQCFFLYEDCNGGELAVLEQNAEQPMLIPIDFPVRSRYSLHDDDDHDGLHTTPGEWLLFEDHDPPYLMLNSTAGIDLLQMKPCKTLPPAATEYYIQHQKTPDPGSILLQTADYVVRAKGERSYVCERNGVKQWKFSGPAYLYTPMICFQDSLIFGTAGNGGHFYVLSIKTGEKIADIKTGGTVAYVQQNNLCYFLVNDPNAKLVCLDVLTGRIVDEVSLGGKNTHSPLQLVGNQLHTVTFYFKNRMLQKAIWHCVTISDEGGMLK